MHELTVIYFEQSGEILTKQLCKIYRRTNFCNLYSLHLTGRAVGERDRSLRQSIIRC